MPGLSAISNNPWDELALMYMDAHFITDRCGSFNETSD